MGRSQARGGTADQLLNTGCYFYFPNGKEKWVNSNAGNTVSDVIVSNAPFTVKVNRDDTALTASNGSYTIDGVNVGDDRCAQRRFSRSTTNPV